MAVKQITMRLEAETKRAFHAYATRFGLDASELARLLIHRERYRRRLQQRGLEGAKPAERSRRRGGARMAAVTAHVSSPEQVCEFDAYAKKCGLSRDRAGAYLLEAELEERGLEKAIIGR